MRRRGPAPGPLGITPAEGALLSLLSLLLGVGVVAPPAPTEDAGRPLAAAAPAVPAIATAPAEPATTATRVVPPRPAPAAASRARSAPARAAVRPVAGGLELWLLLADCESGFRDRHGRVIRGSARWHLDSGNGYYGAFQFAPARPGPGLGRGLPHEASPREQLHRAAVLQRRIGWARAWPVCSRMLGLAPPAA